MAELDICDEKAVMDFVTAHQIDGIVNCAAYTAVDKAEDNVELCDKLNHVAPGYLAKAAQSRGGWLVQVSTDYVFDGTAHIPYKEEDTPCPNSVYGSTKLAGEQEVMKYCPNTMIIRTAWLYSTFGNNFVKTMIRLGKEKETLGVIFDQIGTPTYARDLAQAIFVALEKVSFRVSITSVTKGSAPGMIYQSHSSAGRHYDLPCIAASHGRLSYEGLPSALFRTRQDQAEKDLRRGGALLDGQSGGMY